MGSPWGARGGALVGFGGAQGTAVQFERRDVCGRSPRVPCSCTSLAAGIVSASRVREVRGAAALWSPLAPQRVGGSASAPRGGAERWRHVDSAGAFLGVTAGRPRLPRLPRGRRFGGRWPRALPVGGGSRAGGRVGGMQGDASGVPLESGAVWGAPGGAEQEEGAFGGLWTTRGEWLVAPGARRRGTLGRPRGAGCRGRAEALPV